MCLNTCKLLNAEINIKRIKSVQVRFETAESTEGRSRITSQQTLRLMFLRQHSSFRYRAIQICGYEAAGFQREMNRIYGQNILYAT